MKELLNEVHALRLKVERQDRLIIELISNMNALSQVDWSNNEMTFSPELSNILADLLTEIKL